MIDRTVIHDRFAIERSYRASPSRVFAAFASAEAWMMCGDAGDAEEIGGEAAAYELDFRVGGCVRFGLRYGDTFYRYDGRLCDIVPSQRIVCAYEVYANDVRIWVSVATIEFAKDGDGTVLVWTEQGAYLGAHPRPCAGCGGWFPIDPAFAGNYHAMRFGASLLDSRRCLNLLPGGWRRAGSAGCGRGGRRRSP